MFKVKCLYLKTVCATHKAVQKERNDILIKMSMECHEHPHQATPLTRSIKNVLIIITSFGHYTT